MATQTTARPRVPVEVLINDNLPSSPSDKTGLIVLGSVLGFIVLGVLYYQTIGRLRSVLSLGDPVLFPGGKQCA